MKTSTLPKAILLDMDDTILAAGSAEESWRITCNEFAHRVEKHKPEALFAAIEEYSNWYWSDPERHRLGRLDLNTARRKIVAEVFHRLGIDVPLLADELVVSYSAKREADIKPFPDAIETLRLLQSQGVPLALLTNGDSATQRGKIEKYGLACFFNHICIEGELGFGKPNERAYSYALDLLGVAARETWMVGDNLEWEVAVPQRLGIFAIWLDFAGRGLPVGSTVRPDRIIGSLSELLD